MKVMFVNKVREWDLVKRN